MNLRKKLRGVENFFDTTIDMTLNTSIEMIYSKESECMTATTKTESNVSSSSSSLDSEGVELDEESREVETKNTPPKLKDDADRFKAGIHYTFMDDINIFICSANLGNEEPTKESIAAMIPENGFMPNNYSDNAKHLKAQKYDIIVVGVQEATFTPSHTPTSTAESVFTPMMTIAASVDHINKNTVASKIFKRFNLNDPAEMFGGTRILHERIMQHLGEEYVCCLHYQRGEMRLMIMLKPCILQEIDASGGVFVNGENTGIGSVLPNKGGICASITLRKTRLSFLTAHLAAHEGVHHYKNRCSNIAEIFNCSKVGPTVESRLYDASLTSHYCFVFGDLNFRLDVPKYSSYSSLNDNYNNTEKIKRVMDMVEEEEWHRLNDMDELLNGLKNKDLLAGFETLKCCFPPTYKVQKGTVGFHYNKKRIPSYTDRILWKCADGFEGYLRPLFYDPCPFFNTSDHKPIIGGFSILPKEFEFQPNDNVILPKISSETSIEYSLFLVVDNIQCKGLKNYNSQGFFRETCNPYVMFVTDLSCRPSDDDDGDMAHLDQTIDNIRKFEIIEKLQESKVANGMRQFMEVMRDRYHDRYRLNSKTSDPSDPSDPKTHRKRKWVRYGNPRTRRIKNEVNPQWDRKEDKIIIEVKQGNLSVESLCSDLHGSFLYLSVMHYDVHKGDSLIGTIALTMDRFFPDKVYDDDDDDDTFKVGNNINMSRRAQNSRSKHDDNLSFDKIHGRSDIVEVDQPLLRNGRIQGRLSCNIVSLCCSYEKMPSMDADENTNTTTRSGWACFS